MWFEFALLLFTPHLRQCMSATHLRNLSRVCLHLSVLVFVILRTAFGSKWNLIDWRLICCRWEGVVASLWTCSVLPLRFCMLPWICNEGLRFGARPSSIFHTWIIMYLFLWFFWWRIAEFVPAFGCLLCLLVTRVCRVWSSHLLSGCESSEDPGTHVFRWFDYIVYVLLECCIRGQGDT